MISTRKQLEQAALSYGLLPFFSNNIPGFSVEEMAAPGKLFGEDADDYGCWEWKGPVIHEMTTAYGKFFRRKAGFVALGLYPDFINYRRSVCPLEPDSVEATLLDIIKARESATSAQLRAVVFADVRPRRQALEAPLQRLQMGGRLLIADFQYKYTRQGTRYGWGEAVYTTPEIWFGEEITRCDRTPEESFEVLVDYLAARLPQADRRQIVRLLSSVERAKNLG